MARSQLNIRIPPDLEEKIQSHAQEAGITKTDIMLNALWQYFGSSEELTLKQQLVDLQRRVAQLETLVGVER